MGLLGRESALHALLRVVILARLVLVLNHIDRALKPLGEKHSVLPAARWIHSFGISTKFLLMLFSLENIFLVMKRAFSLRAEKVLNYVSSLKKLTRGSRPIAFARTDTHFHFTFVTRRLQKNI